MKYSKIQVLLQEKADYTARLNLIPYDGSPEIKENNSGRYLYVRKRIAGKLSSTYVGVYSDELYQLLLKNAKEARELRKAIRKLDKDLARLGYEESSLKKQVILNIDFARANLKQNIYNQAVLEGIGTTFPQTEDIIDNGKVSGVKTNDIQKILNLKRAWEFILDKDVISYGSDYSILCNIAKLINQDFYVNGGQARKLPVSIGGSSYIPPIPEEDKVKEEIKRILNSKKKIEEKAIDICLFCMKSQIFIDGNKRAGVIFANHYLISKGKGMLIIPENKVSEFKKLLVLYYENRDKGKILEFMRNECLQRI
ncbi:MAG: cell filamentation protein Fic [Candidatus Delongbacteria bacterium]|nr:MAG: cell filamentation protein Fic [Candidatus Delongbacteria bacterium]